MQKNVMIIAAVVVVAIAAGGAIFVLGSGGNDYENLKVTNLPVYGNANEDYIVDQKDVDLINQIIGTSVSEHPYADADGDGAITATDAEIVKKLIKGEKTKVRFIDQHVYDVGTTNIVEVDYPLENVITINPDMLQLTFMFDGDEKVIGYIANRDSYGKTFYKADNNGFTRCLGTSPRMITQAEWEAIKDLDSELYKKNEGIGAILAYNDAALSDYKDDIEVAGIPVIYIRCTDPVHSIDATLLLGFLLGPDYSKKAMNYANDSRKAIVDLTEKVEKLSDSDRTEFIALCMWKYISQHDSQYTKIGLQAGGIDVANLPGNGSNPLNDVEAITIYNDKIDYIMNCRTCDCIKVDPLTLWEDSRIDILKKSSEFKNMFYLNLSIPTPCRVMYVAAMFYPDIVSMSEAHNYFQTMVDKYLSYLNNTVADNDFNVVQDMTTICTYQDYMDAKGGSGDDDIESDIDVVALAERFWNIMKDDLNSNLDPMIDYSYTPYKLSEENNSQMAKVVSDGETYFIKYTLEKDPKAKYSELKATYEAKIGTEARTTGICMEIPYSNALTEGFGYYVNSNPDAQYVLGSMKYVGYIDECLVDLQIVKRPHFTMEDIEKLIYAAYPAASDQDAKAWADAIDTSIFDKYAGSPYKLLLGADKEYASIKAADSGSGDRHINFSTKSDAYTNFTIQKNTFEEKVAGYEGTDTKCYVMDDTGFDEAYGYLSDRHRDGAFMAWMIYYVGMKDGCYIDICLRIDDPNYTVAEANSIVKAILDAQP